MELADEETRKRALVEPTEDDDDEPAENYWRAEDFVAKASMDELTGTWITYENGILDEDAAEDTWTDCLGAGGQLDRQAADEAIEKALDSLLAHGFVEDMRREDAKGFKTLTTRWDTLEDEGRRAENEGEIRWARKQMGRTQRRLVFSWGDAFCESCDRLLGIEDGLGNVRGRRSGCLLPGFLSTKKWWGNLRWSTFERRAKAGRDTDMVWRLRQQLPGRRAAGQSWVEHVAGILVNRFSFDQCTTAPQFYWSSERMVALELHIGWHSWRGDSEWTRKNRQRSGTGNQFQGR